MQDFLSALSAPGPSLYRALGTPAALKQYPSMLEKTLREAKKSLSKTELQKPASATFESTARALLDADADVSMLWSALQNHHRTDGSEATKALIQTWQPRLMSLWNALSMSRPCYELLKHVQKTQRSLPPAEKRSLHLLLRGMELGGVHLPPAKQKKLKAINKQLAALAQRFSDNVTESRKPFFHQFTNDASLTDVPEQDMHAAAVEAKKRKLKGWVFTLAEPSSIAVLRYCSDREVRRKFLIANHNSATSGTHDNRPLILRILRLRQEQATLLGYRRFADYMVDDRMAGSVKNIEKMLADLAPQMRAKAREEIRELKTFAAIRDLQWWDVPYYAQKLRRAKYDVNEKEVKQYFPLEDALKGIFEVANRLFGVTFKEEKESTDGLRVFAMRTGKSVAGYLLLDLFARPTKRGGAWCADLRPPLFRDGKQLLTPVVICVGSFGKAAGKAPTLLRHGEVITLFHEFGHAMHVLLSRTPERNLHAFHVEHDFVELPSQLLENWCWEEAALRTYARHVTTGRPIPGSLIAKLRASRRFLQGFDGLGQVSFGSMDMALHTRRPPRTVRELEALCMRIAKKFSVLPVPPEYRRYASFSHIFAGGYAAGYYGYLWAEVLEADIFEAIAKAGLFDKKTGKRLHDEVLSVGASRPGMESFRAFMGRKPDPKALLRKKGLV